MVDLNDLLPEGSPWMLQSAAGINASGQIAGQGLMPRRNARFSYHTKEQVNEFSTISYPRLTSAAASTSGGNRNGNEIRGPSIAEQYDALKLRDEIVVIARGKRSAGSTIALKQSDAGTDYHFPLLQHELLESVALPPGIEPFTAFRGFRSSKTPVQQIRVRDKSR